MRYAGIEEFEVNNGEGIGCSLFVQGCHFHCKNCFNQETWDFNGGMPWTIEVKNEFYKLIKRPYIKRVSILGGEPLAYENLLDVYDLVNGIKTLMPTKKIWLLTGNIITMDDLQNIDVSWDNGLLKNHILRKCNYVIDGQYIDELKDLTLPFRGSSNQRIIDIQKSIKKGEIVLWS